VLQPLAGRPLLAHVLDCARELAANDVCVVYGHGAEQVRAKFPSSTIRWALQAQQLGTGHAMLQAMPGTPEKNRVLVLFGDVPLLMATTLRSMLDAGQEDDVLVLTVDMEDPTGYGRIIRDGDAVTGIVEEKDASASQREISEINTGVMVCPGAKLRQWLGKLSNDNAQGEYYLTDVIGMAVADRITVHGFKARNQEEVMGVNDRKQLAEAERALQARLVDELMSEGVSFADPARVDIRGKLTCGRDVFIDVNAVFEGEVSLGNGVRIESNNVIRDSVLGNGVVVHPNCYIEDSKAGDGCEIGPFARLRPGAKLASKVKVGNFVEIKKSNIGKGSKVNHLTYIGDSDIGEGVNVGAGTVTCNYDGANKYQTTIGDGAFIGSSVNLVAPVEVGKGATIGAGSTISKDAPAGQLTLERSKQFTVKGWKRPMKKS
jgi:bifunctional UDP-N-acetylglucosamine pyrophosphorylase/glucosamine-1-phosphate N-acetyltransferase